MKALASIVRAGAAAGVAAGLALAPSIAQACPYCAGNNEGGIGQTIAVAAMVSSPFIAVAVSIPFVVRLLRKEAASSPDAHTEESDE